MTQDTNTASVAAIKRYKIGYHADEWGQRSSTPSGIPDASGSWVRYADHVTALAAGRATAAQAVVPADQDDSLHLCASDLQHSAIYDNHVEMQSCMRAVADRITALAPAQPAAQHYGPLRDADAEHGKQLSVYSTPRAQPAAPARDLAAVIKGAADKLDAAVRCHPSAVDTLIHEALEILDGDREPDGDSAHSTAQADTQPAPAGATPYPMAGDEDESDLGNWQDGATKPTMDGTYLREFDEGLATSEFYEGKWLRDGFFPSDIQDAHWRGRNAPQPYPTAQVADSVQEDAARYRWLAASCRSTSEHWGGRWSIVVEGPAPKSHDSEDDFDAAIDAAMATNGGNK